ncbi:MAG: CpsB/CapC family capsule biosynthesis tyrosine phosphatase, partial [Hyphomicrobiaceae bacterium]
ILIEPPHHVMPARFEETLFGLMVGGLVPIVTHPERLSWIRSQYAMLERLVGHGVWMQITAGSMTGKFGQSALDWSTRMLDDGLVHIVASDAHDMARRRPDLREGYEAVARRVGEEEASALLVIRPRGVIADLPPDELPRPARGRSGGHSAGERAEAGSRLGVGREKIGTSTGLSGTVRGLGRRLRRLIE